MVPIATRRPAQHGTRQKRLTPQCDEALWIQVTRMHGPDSQTFGLAFALCPLPFDLTSYRYFSHQAGLRSLTRANHRLSGMSTARTVIQHR